MVNTLLPHPCSKTAGAIAIRITPLVELLSQGLENVLLRKWNHRRQPLRQLMLTTQLRLGLDPLSRAEPSRAVIGSEECPFGALDGDTYGFGLVKRNLTKEMSNVAITCEFFFLGR